MSNEDYYQASIEAYGQPVTTRERANAVAEEAGWFEVKEPVDPMDSAFEDSESGTWLVEVKGGAKRDALEEMQNVIEHTPTYKVEIVWL